VGQVALASARKLGLSEEWVRGCRTMIRSGPGVERRQGGGGNARREPAPAGDLLLGIDGMPVTRLREAERAVQKERWS